MSTLDSDLSPQLFSSAVQTLRSASSDSTATSLSSATRRLHADQFTLLEELGSGSFGVVYRAIDK
jgi:hypothetical protein